MSSYRWPTRRPPPDDEDAATGPSVSAGAGRRVTPDERRALDDERTASVKARVEAEASATDEKTARLRAMRLAREAASELKRS